MKFCPNCGSQRENNSPFCKDCGAAFESISQPQAPQQPQSQPQQTYQPQPPQPQQYPSQPQQQPYQQPSYQPQPQQYQQPSYQPQPQQPYPQQYPYAAQTLDDPNHKYRKLGGWLLFFVITNILGAIANTVISIISIGETVSSYGLIDELSHFLPDNFRTVLNITLVGEVIGLLTIVFSVIFIIQVFMRKSAFLLFAQLSILAGVINALFVSLIPSLIIGSEFVDASMLPTSIGQLAGMLSGFLLLTLYYCKSVRVSTYMGSVEYKKKAIFAYKSNDYAGGMKNIITLCSMFGAIILTLIIVLISNSVSGASQNNNDNVTVTAPEVTPRETVGGDNPLETLQAGEFSLVLNVFGPFLNGTFAIIIDEEGTLTREYRDFYDEDHAIPVTRQLEDDEIAELIEVIFENDFFNLPIRFTDTEYPQLSGATSTFITITHDGINYISGGVGDGTEESRRFAAIANFIERMANETEVQLSPDPAVITENVIDKPYVMVLDFVPIPGYYTGEWADGAPNGFGEFTNGESGESLGEFQFHEGAVIRGTFVDGFVEGFAEYECPTTGDSFMGDYVKGIRNGFGIYIWGNGDTYVGNFIYNLFNGKGTLTFADGEIWEAYWSDGHPVGDVIVTLADGTILDVVYLDGEIVSVTER